MRLMDRWATLRPTLAALLSLLSLSGLAAGGTRGEAEQVALMRAMSAQFEQGQRLSGDRSAAGADGENSDNFGWTVAIQGDTALVGVPNDTVQGNPLYSTISAGSVYVFTHTQAGWTLQTKLFHLGSTGFGRTVALQADQAFVGSVGGVHVFSRNAAGQWNQDGDIGSEACTACRFDQALAVSAESLLIGATRYVKQCQCNEGTVLVYGRLGKQWVQQALLAPPDGAADDRFGSSVALSGDVAMIGAPGHDVGMNADQGAVYVFRRNQSIWEYAEKLSAADGIQAAGYGTAVAAYGNDLAIGAPAQTTTGVTYLLRQVGTQFQAQTSFSGVASAGGSGAAIAMSDGRLAIGTGRFDFGGVVLLYQRIGTTWSSAGQIEQDVLEYPEFGGFSQALAMSGERLLVGAPTLVDRSSPQRGRAFIYAVAQSGSELESALTSGRGGSDLQFGMQMAIWGDTAVVGVPAEPTEREDTGAVYVFWRDNGVWKRQAKLGAQATSPSRFLGRAVAIHGDTLLVCARDLDSANNKGLVFQRIGGTWALQAVLRNSVSVEPSPCSSVALTATTAFLGYPSRTISNIYAGAVDVFERSGQGWTEATQLLAPIPVNAGLFGNALAASGERLLVGAPIYSTAASSAHLYERKGSQWTIQASFECGLPDPNCLFGATVALDGDTALIGAPAIPSLPPGSAGFARLYHYDGSVWSLQEQLQSPDSAARDGFGSHVALHGDTAVITDSRNGSNTTAYLFRRQAADWTLQETILPREYRFLPIHRDENVAMHGNTVLYGAVSEPGLTPFGNIGDGAVHVFTAGLFSNGFEGAPEP